MQLKVYAVWAADFEDENEAHWQTEARSPESAVAQWKHEADTPWDLDWDDPDDVRVPVQDVTSKERWEIRLTSEVTIEWDIGPAQPLKSTDG